MDGEPVLMGSGEFNKDPTAYGSQIQSQIPSLHHSDPSGKGNILEVWLSLTSYFVPYRIPGPVEDTDQGTVAINAET